MRRIAFLIIIIILLSTSTVCLYNTVSYADEYGEETEYTEEEKEQAKAWLSAHGYPPTRDGAYAAYADFLAGKFNDDPEVMRMARQYGLVPEEEPHTVPTVVTVDSSGNDTTFETYTPYEHKVSTETDAVKATPTEATPAEATLAEPTPTEPAVATATDTDDRTRFGFKESTVSLGMKILRVVFVIASIGLVGGFIFLIIKRAL